jgi:hypothetical protein
MIHSNYRITELNESIFYTDRVWYMALLVGTPCAAAGQIDDTYNLIL